MSGQKRVRDLKRGDLTQHAGGACTCGRSGLFRVEKLNRYRGGIDVTWSHPPCGRTFDPLPCSPDLVVRSA